MRAVLRSRASRSGANANSNTLSPSFEFECNMASSVATHEFIIANMQAPAVEQLNLLPHNLRDDNSLKHLSFSLAYVASIGYGTAAGADEQVWLLYGCQQDVIKEVVLVVGSYNVTSRKPSDDFCFGFRGLDVVEYLRHSLKVSMQSRREKMKQTFGDREVFVKSKQVRDMAYTSTREGRVIDGYRYRTHVVIGYRAGDERVHVREVALDTAQQLCRELRNITMIVSFARQNSIIFFNVFYGLLLLRLIEPDTRKWSQAALDMLATEGMVEAAVEQVFAKHQRVLTAKAEDIGCAMNVDVDSLKPYFCRGMAVDHLRACLRTSDLLVDTFYNKLFQF